MLLEWTVDGVTVRNEHYFCEHKKCALPDARIEETIAKCNGGFSVTLETDQPALWVGLDVDGIRGHFDDNAFALLPGEPRTLTFSCEAPAEVAEFTKCLTVRHLRQTYP